jgi:hypothetical protein
MTTRVASNDDFGVLAFGYKENGYGKFDRFTSLDSNVKLWLPNLMM